MFAALLVRPMKRQLAAQKSLWMLWSGSAAQVMMQTTLSMMITSCCFLMTHALMHGLDLALAAFVVSAMQAYLLVWFQLKQLHSVLLHHRIASP